MFWSNEIEYVQENIVRKYVDCRTALPTHSVVVADTAHKTYICRTSRHNGVGDESRRKKAHVV